MFADRCPGFQPTYAGALPHAKTMARLAEHDVLIMPSRFEGLPFALIEAMGLGVVPVVSRLPGCTEGLVEHGTSGFLAAVDRPGEFAEALVAAAADRSRLRDMSQRAWAGVGGTYGVDAVGTAYDELILRVQSGRAGPRARTRSGRVEASLLGDLPCWPRGLVRPARKALRVLGLWDPHTGRHAA
jgi:hypothetical protein